MHLCSLTLFPVVQHAKYFIMKFREMRIKWCVRHQDDGVCSCKINLKFQHFTHTALVASRNKATSIQLCFKQDESNYVKVTSLQIKHKPIRSNMIWYDVQILFKLCQGQQISVVTAGPSREDYYVHFFSISFCYEPWLACTLDSWCALWTSRGCLSIKKHTKTSLPMSPQRQQCCVRGEIADCAVMMNISSCFMFNPAHFPQ